MTSSCVLDLGVDYSSQFTMARSISYTELLESFSSRIRHQPQPFPHSYVGSTLSPAVTHIGLLQKSV